MNKHKGKLIVVEGTDCNGKETQSNLLVENLNKIGIKTEKYCFPRYNSPTGKIIAGAYLGKPEYGEGYFTEGASKVDPLVASLYFSADRKYNIKDITTKLDSGINVVVDRYVDSNLAHQGAKIKDIKQRNKFVKTLQTLEYKLLELPKPDITVFLYMPFACANILKANRKEKSDQHESDDEYLQNSEKMYLYLAKKNRYIKIDCSKENSPKDIQQIQQEIFDKIVKMLKN